MDDKENTKEDIRERKLTEKGLSYNLDLKQKERSRLMKVLTGLSNELERLMSESTQTATVKTIHSKWINIYEKLLETHDQYQNLIEDVNDKHVDNAWFQDKNSVFIAVNKTAMQWFAVNKANSIPSQGKHKDEDVESHRSARSHASTGSRRSSAGSSHRSSHLSVAKLKEEQRKVELLARAEAIAEKKQLEEAKLKLKFQEEELEIKTELKVSDAKARVIEELERSIMEDNILESNLIKSETLGDISDRQKTTQRIQVENKSVHYSQEKPTKTDETSVLNPHASEWIPSQPTLQKTILSNNVNDINNNKPIFQTESLSIARELNKPKADVQKFDGNPMMYKEFLRQFHARVVLNTESYDERLTYLLQFTVGEPHKIVKGFSHLDSKIGYEAALNEFKDRYGEPDVIAHSFVQKVLNWPLIKPDNPKALDEFSIFLTECLYAVQNVDEVRVLEYSENLKLLVRKLPFYLQEKWRNIVYETKSRHQTVKFQQLVEFVKRESKKANDPVYGKDVMRTTSNVKKLQEPKSQAVGSRRTLATAVEPKMKSSRNQSVGTTGKEYKRGAFSTPCVYCENSNHSLDKCNKFSSVLLKDRYDFLKSKGFCFGCLRYGHQKISCRQKSTCATCNKEHPSILHVEAHKSTPQEQASEHQSSKATNSTTFTGAGDIQQALPILPVRVYCANSDKFVETYAFLDSGSTASFCSETIMHDLHIEGKRTKLNLLTMGHQETKYCYVISGLQISDLYGNNILTLPPIYSQENLPVTSNDIVSISDIQKWPHLSGVPLQRIDSKHVGLLIGINVPKIMEPYDVIPSVENGPFAVNTLFGWVINGPLDVSASADASCSFAVSNIIDARIFTCLDEQLRDHFNRDFNERIIDDVPEHSKEDKQFLDIVSNSTKFESGHYVVSLPFKCDNVKMPNNRKQAEQRLLMLAKRFDRTPEFRRDYVSCIEKVISEGYAQKVSVIEDDHENGRTWYLPHHGVYHQKKGKLRVVFDCAARYKGTSLNDQLLQGPNLTNTLVGTLIRFRIDDVALMGDIDSMFHQVRVPPEDANFLRFLWWENGDTSKHPTEYQMSVHLFGAKSSPSCANYALRKTAIDNKGCFSDEVINTVLRNFYVDDCLKSVGNTNDAVNLVSDLQALLLRGGFRIAKWVSNSRDVMQSIPVTARAKGVQDLDLDHDSLPVDRALGVEWNVESDAFCFKMALAEQKITRRGILSTLSSVYDPLGFVAPCMLKSKGIMQELCKLHLQWDDPIPEGLTAKWSSWLQDIEKLSDFKIDRCIKPPGFGSIKSTQLHHFADASEIGYGTVTYLRLENDNGRVHCSFIIGKSRVAPLKQITIPRLELTAATVAVRVNKMLTNELDIPIDQTFFWTDSMSVLRYIWNTATRFHTFVANRLAVIHDGSVPGQWRYISSELNPADHASRGVDAEALLRKGKWLVAPQFLWEDEDQWPNTSSEDVKDISNEDPEVKRVLVRTAIAKPDELTDLNDLFRRYSNWTSLKRSVAWILKIRTEILRRVRQREDEITHSRSSSDEKTVNTSLNHITVKDMSDAENAILSYIQQQEFAVEIDTLMKGNSHVKSSSYIRKLDPVLLHGLLRVGGRLCNSSMPAESKHPIILPKSHHVSDLILRQIHTNLKHSGRNHMLSRLRETYWLVNAPSAIRKLLSKCVVCRRQNTHVGEQKMANLPKDRVTPDEPPFTRVGVDYFGPFLVKQKRSQVKRYGVIFTCLASRAVHIEIADSLDTNSYINALRRFVARRGQVSKMRSDNGTNFIGSEKELAKSINEWNTSVIQDSMIQKGIDWQFNPPAGSHFGGVWERLIRSIRKVINSVVKEQLLNDDCLHTLFCEIEAILNDRPITVNSDNPDDLEPLTPNHLLLMKRKPNLPPGVFNKADNYSKRRWRQVQYMANLFWHRWVREYLPLLQEREKWNEKKRNLKVGDIVLIVDANAPRNSWPMGLVLATIPDKSGLVRQVKVKTSTNVLIRPVDKLCVLLEMD